MDIDEVAIPALERRDLEFRMHVKVDWSDGGFGHEDFLGLSVKGEAFGWIDLVTGFGDKAIVVGITPAGLIVAALGEHEFKESGSVDVVTNPSHAGDGVVTFAHGVGLDLGLLVVETDVDAEIGTPHLLDRLCDAPVSIAGVEENLQFGKAFATRKSGSGKESLGFGQITRKKFPGGVTRGIGRGQVLGGQLTAEGDLGHELFPVDGERGRGGRAHHRAVVFEC